jgi:selenocysteine lyase/cysteine desulfurase
MPDQGERDAIPQAVRFAARHLAVSSSRNVAPADFMRAIAGEEASDDARRAVATFLNEADPAEIADLVACGATSFVRLSRIAARTLPPSHPNRVYLEQLAA